jgi:glucuronate isomerase
MTSFSDKYFNLDPAHLSLARDLYQQAAALPLVCPHGHVDPLLFADPDYHFGNPVELLILPDHYVLRVLHANGVSYDDLGIPRRDGKSSARDPQQVWQIFADHFYCYAGTPTGIWLRDELTDVFGIDEPLNGKNARAVYEAIQTTLSSADFTPRKLYSRFNIAALSTTDGASDDLHLHQQIKGSGWQGNILPTMRLDTIVNIDTPTWRGEVEKLAAASKISVTTFAQFLQAIEARRAYFLQNGATATDLAVVQPTTAEVPAAEMEQFFQKGLAGTIDAAETARFIAGMLVELARMSSEDGLVMQLHVGSYRNHDQALYSDYGPDLGADFPIQVEFTRALQPLLNRFGNHANFGLILFTLDESTYARELAPLASYYPAVKLGPPWWFHDNLNGMQRFFEQAVDACGLYRTVGFNDDTRAFLSIPARHDVWRRASANWLAGLTMKKIVDEATAGEMMKALSCGLALKAYKLEEFAPKEARLA